MFRNRFIVMIAALLLLFITTTVSRPFYAGSTSRIDTARDFYERHPDWTSLAAKPLVPVTNALDYSDYAQRHPELIKVNNVVDRSDYFQRHPELWTR